MSSASKPQNAPSILERLPGSLPKAHIPPSTDTVSAATEILQSFPQLEKHHFASDALWRDTYALTGTIRTFYFDDSVAAEWKTLSNSHGLSRASLVPGSAKVISPGDGIAWVDCTFTFESSTPATKCSGILSLVPSSDGSWRIWVLRTILEQLTGHPNVDTLKPATGLLNHSVDNHDAPRHASNGLNGHEQTSNGTNGVHDNRHFGAVIIGGGQSGLSTGGRLQALGVSYVIIEKNAQVGDAWKLRYESARCTYAPI